MQIFFMVILKKIKNDFVADIDNFVKANPSVVWFNGRYDITLDYSHEINSYGIYLKIPHMDNKGNIISEGVGHCCFDPLYCMLSTDIFTVQEWEEKKFKTTKQNRLEELLKEIKSL